MSRDKNFDCIYCGEYADERDHIPPKKWRFGLAGVVPFRVVPACKDCNHMLGGKALFTISERREYVRAKLWRRNKKFIIAPGWHERELDELGPNLRAYVEAAQRRKKHVLRRIGMLRGGEDAA